MAKPSSSLSPGTVDSLEACQGPTQLPRAIGFGGAIAVVVGTIIGSGVFLVPHNIALQVGSTPTVILVWILGGALALAGSLSLAELGAATPEAGGVYIYLRDAYGKLAAFLYGWAALLVIESGGIATLAVAFGIYSSTFFPLTPLERKLVASGVITLLTLVNIAGVKRASGIQTLFTLAKLTGLAIIVGFALFARHLTPIAPPAGYISPHATLKSFGVALVAVLWAYHGWHHLSHVAGEVKNPARVLPRSFLLGALIIVAAYLSANFAYLHVLSLPVMAQDSYQRVAARVMEILWGPQGSAFVSGLILCSIFGACNGNILGGARAYYAMARDRVMFSAVGRIHPRFQTPYVALLIQGAWSILLAVTGTFEQLYTFVIFTGWIFYAAAALAVVILRRKFPQLARPYRVYTALPLAFAAAALVIILNSLAGNPRESGTCLGLVLLGIPVYLIWKKGQTYIDRQDTAG
ncbi:MAG TPA: amino acid permease [Terriglobia bacterium]|nr:amino acid permease [Terriglobia bacterium]